MINKNDRLKAGLQPLLAKTLENALAHSIAKEFPRIGEPRICKLCAEMIMEVVNNHIRSKDYVHHGQYPVEGLCSSWPDSLDGRQHK